MAARVGLVGIGLVGTALAKLMLARGLEVVGYDLDESRQQALKDMGGNAAASPAAVAAAAPRVVLSLLNTDVVLDVVEGQGGLAKAGGPMRHIIDTTTGDPDATAALAGRLAASGIGYVDATLSGSSAQIGAREAVVMAGGSAADFKACEDLLHMYSDSVFHLGPAGSGARAKLASNLVLGLNRLALAEGLVFAEKLGLELKPFLELLKASPAYSAAMDAKGGKMIDGDFVPQSRVRQHHKDVAMMLQYAAAAGQALPLSTVHLALMQRAMDAGDGDLDNAAVIREIRRMKA